MALQIPTTRRPECPSKSCFPKTRCRASGTTSRPTCRTPCNRRSVPTATRSPRDARAGLPDEPDRAGGQQERWIDIPEPVLEIYSRWRPVAALPRRRPGEGARHARPGSTTRTRASRPPASHKPNTAVAQAYYNKVFGIKKLTTETGAGQWGCALSFACIPARPRVQGLHGAHQLRPEALPQDHDADLGRPNAWPARATETNAGREILAEDPDTPGQPRHRHQRGHRGGGFGPQRGDPLLARQRAQPRHAPPDDHRPRSQEAARQDRRKQGRRGDRLRRRRQQLRRPRIPVRHRQDPRRRHRHHPGRAAHPVPP